MTTELEQEFFKVFGIEKSSKNCPMLDKNNCIFVPSECNYYQYPEITDRKLLEMICLIADICNYSGDVFDIEQNSINELKKFILHFLINYMKTEHTDTFYKNDEVKICVQQLFKGKE